VAQIVKFDKVVPGGKALARWNGKALFVAGPLPDESAEVRVTREKRDWAEGEVLRYERVSPRRREPLEAHYMSCSPWQGVDYDYQLELKRGMLAEVYGRPGLKLEVGEVLGSPAQLGYRNKLEFALRADESGKLGLALHARGSNDFMAAPHGCVLGTDKMNRLADDIVAVANELGLAKLAETLTVRQSHTHGRVIAVLTLNEGDAGDRDWSRLMATGAAGVIVLAKGKGGYQKLWSQGTLTLTESVGGINLTYPWDSFFQINLPAFEMALERILAEIRPGSDVIDLYGGAGTIGLPAARIANQVVGIEIVPSSVSLANHNAAANGLENYRAIAVGAEDMDPANLAGADTVIVDPPRAGLHSRVAEMLLEAAPRRIIYLSCNPVTQARDLMRLSESYRPGSVTGFDFYPGTLHLESLVTLVRK
jgi:23S rRNA (uracil1939-C5)-methyltransferase